MTFYRPPRTPLFSTVNLRVTISLLILGTAKLHPWGHRVNRHHPRWTDLTSPSMQGHPLAVFSHLFQTTQVGDLRAAPSSDGRAPPALGPRPSRTAEDAGYPLPANPSDEVSMTQEFGYRNRKRPSRARPSTAPHLLTGLGTTELSLRVTTPGMAAASTAPTPAADTGPPSTTPDTPQDRSSHEELLPAEDGTLELPGHFCLEDLLPISLSDDVSRASSSRDGPRQSRSAAKMRVRAGLRCMQCYALKADCSCGKNTVRAAELSLSLLKAPARSVQKTCPFDAKLQAPRPIRPKPTLSAVHRGWPATIMQVGACHALALPRPHTLQRSLTQSHQPTSSLSCINLTSTLVPGHQIGVNALLFINRKFLLSPQMVPTSALLN